MVKRSMVLGLALVSLFVAVAVGETPDAVSLGALDSPLGTLAVAGMLATPGQLDWYAFEVLEPAMVYILAEGRDNAESLRAILYDDSFSYIGVSDHLVLAAQLEPGIYSVRIDSIETAVQHYDLVISNGIEVESNDGLVEALALGTVEEEVLVFGAIDPAGDTDFYRFEIPDEGLPDDAYGLLIEVDGTGLDDSLIVLYAYSDEEGRYLPILVDDNSGDGYWSRILMVPDPGGRYALRVEETGIPLVGIREYALRILPLAVQADVEPNDTVATAGAWTELSETDQWATAGLLGGGDSVDYYALHVEESALLEVRTAEQGVSGEFDTAIAVYDSSGALLAENDDAGDSLWSRLTVAVAAGDYAIAVRPVSSDGALLPYRLSAALKQVQEVAEQEPNDSETEAQAIDWSPGEVLIIYGRVGEEADIDSYRLTLERGTTLVFETGPDANGIDGDTTLALYDEDLYQIAYNDDFDGSWSRIEQTLEAGVYFVVVESYFSDSFVDYSLLVSE